MKYLIEQQVLSGDDLKKLSRADEKRAICNIPWKYLKHVVMKGKRVYDKLVIPLDEHDQFLI